ncbi:MAG: hypothetical protein NTW14_11910, partial [bacterium]|nr:hypothetical protein [bacterium]
MLRYTLTLIGFLSFICAVKAQLPLPTIQWSNIYGGNQNNDVCYAAEQTSNGGFILGGYTARNYIGGEDLCLIKIDSLGNQEWLHTYGGAGPDLGKCMTLAADGGYLIAGYTYSFGAGLADMYLVKTDAQGNQQWQRTYGGPGYDYCESIEPTSDGGYILGGNSTSFPGSGWGAMYLVKIDSVGTIQWQHTYNGQNGSGCASVKQTLDGGYIAGGGYIYSQSSSDLWLVKTNGLGIVEWDQKYGGSSHDGCFDVELTDNGGYIAGGASDSFGSGYQIYVVKTDSLGTMQWQRNYGGYYGDYCYSVLKTPDSGFLLGGVNSGNYW